MSHLNEVGGIISASYECGRGGEARGCIVNEVRRRRGEICWLLRQILREKGRGNFMRA